MKIVKAECGISFRLRDPKSKSPTPIVCIVEYDGKPVIKISTGLKILPSKWNASNEKPVGGLKGLDTESAENINDRIKQIKQEVESQHKGYLKEYNQYPDKKDFKSSVVKALSGEVTNDEAALEKDTSFISFLALQIKRSESGIRLKLSNKGKGHNYSKETINDYRVALNFLKKYLEDRKIKALDFNDITLDLYYDLQEYTFNDRSLSLNYFGKIIKHIKTFMGEAQEMGCHVNEAYKSRRFIKPQEETDAISEC